MSAIAGVLRFDGRPVSRHELERVANALAPYGPDRSGVIVRDKVGLVHRLMRMTPEDRFDRQPWQSASGALIAADLRLDNRDDMLARIGVAQQDAAAWPDSRILLAAWETLGDAVWPLLRGPFAAAIYNVRSGTLTLARDQLGLNVVMWHGGSRFFAFATMPNGLFALSDVPRLLSEEKFADFLVLNHADHTTTMYRDVLRVAPAHIMHVTADGTMTQRRYWSPAEVKPIRLVSDQDYAEGLRACLDRAVRRQMRSAHPIGCLLSGGLDSSSVAALAARALGERNQRLATFTAVPRPGFADPMPTGHYADETPYVEAIAKAVPNLDVNYVNDEMSDPFAELDRFFNALDGPVRNPTHLGWILALLRGARAQGRRVLLGGLYGNTTISWDGWSQAAAHLAHGRLVTAYRQWRLYYRCTSLSRWGAARRLFVEPFVPRRLGHPRPWQDHAAIRADFAAAMAVDDRAREAGHDFHYRPRCDERIKSLTQADYAGDWFAAEKAFTGVEVRDPTADIDVVSYCLGIPPEQYLTEGIDRSLIRRAMWGLLPEMVLTNRRRGRQAPDWYEKLRTQQHALSRDIAALSQSPLARRAIDLKRLAGVVGNWPTDDWNGAAVFRDYNLLLARGIAGGRFLRWFERTN